MTGDVKTSIAARVALLGDATVEQVPVATGAPFHVDLEDLRAA